MKDKQIKKLRKYAKTNLENFEFDKNISQQQLALGKWRITHYKEFEEIQEENERKKNLES